MSRDHSLNSDSSLLAYLELVMEKESSPRMVDTRVDGAVKWKVFHAVAYNDPADLHHRNK